MGIFVVFSVGIGHFSRRLTMEEYVRATNQKLSFLRTQTRVIDWYHVTGNFVVQTSEGNRLSIADDLSLALGVPCAVLSIPDVATYAAAAEKASSPPIETGIRWTRGIAFWVKGKPCTSNLKPSSRAVFFPIDRHAVGVFKRDPLSDEELSDMDSRVGGWGAISTDIEKVVGGTWTARALNRIEGTTAKAVKYSQSKSKSQLDSRIRGSVSV